MHSRFKLITFFSLFTILIYLISVFLQEAMTPLTFESASEETAFERYTAAKKSKTLEAIRSTKTVKIIKEPKKVEVIKAPQSTEINLSYIPENLTVSKDKKNIIDTQTLSDIFYKKIIPLNLTLNANRVYPRGQVTGWELILSNNISSLAETTKVLGHEMGHIVDIYHLKKNIYDVSDIFYNISWVSKDIKKKETTLNDFVSGYAASNKYEDFAESLTMYVFHNEKFHSKTLKNYRLKQKYNFFKKHIFKKWEFTNTDFSTGEIADYNWDATKISINLKKYLYYIK